MIVGHRQAIVFTRIFSAIALLTAAILAAATPLRAQELHWSVADTQRLIAWLEDAPNDGLRSFAAEAFQLRAFLTQDDTVSIDGLATRAAVRLLEEHRNGCCHLPLRRGWNIQSDQTLPAVDAVSAAVATHNIDGLYGWTRPSHPNYIGLRQALARETNAAKRELIVANMDRWRWMPRTLGQHYILVNIASFKATYWQDGVETDSWDVIVGKTRTPTPIFAATATGVIFNPWWEIPTSIAREGIGKAVRSSPKRAAGKGYVWQNGRYRQRPGPTNALGRMKLVMPNRYSVYLHDTPAKSLFAQESRAFSHGCIRVGDALRLATTLLATDSQWTRASTETAVASGRTQMVKLTAPIPIYITYFTAEADAGGTLASYVDIYGKDRNALAMTDDILCCPA